MRRPDSEAVSDGTVDAIPPHPVVVGIGASAGGLSALKSLLKGASDDTGLAWVVVVHLSPEHESHLAELLQPHVAMPVRQVTETVELRPDVVFVIPPNANLEAIDTHLRLSELEERRYERAPIDHFFRTLSRTHDGDAIGVVLTGTGSDGSIGLKEIKAKGGLTIVQDPSQAEYDGMPRSALATGVVDLVLPLERIPGAILDYAKTQPRIRVPEADEEDVSNQSQDLLKVFARIRGRTGRDFSRYKNSTVLRRIARRMQMDGVEELSSYVELLEHDPDEVKALADDLLITVTSFFRDPEVFEGLKADVIPKLFAGKSADDTVRIWSVGCATGEEAYSLAMLLLERWTIHESPPALQIFATDLHEPSLEKGRLGFYPGDIESEVSEPRLRRFFRKEDGGYRVRKEVRDSIVFAPHDLLCDPPFSRMDLISCRNLLIYLQRDVQADVIEIFHYALRDGGHLVCGSSESMASSELFSVTNKELCIYVRRNVPTRDPRLPVFPLTPSRLGWPRYSVDRLSVPPPYGSLHQLMIDRYAPPSLLLSPEDRIVHLSDRVGRFLVHDGGDVTTSIHGLVRDELRHELRSALQVVRLQGKPLRTRPMQLSIEGRNRDVMLDVHPVPDERDGFVLIIFDEREPQEAERAESEEDAAAPEGDALQIERLEGDLAVSRQRLRAIVEQYDVSQEEMKASNEELQSANEELRSTLEELETSREELQSMNEELQTVNQENRHKVEELRQLTGDLHNLLSATDIATLFLDREFRINRFTPKLADLFNVRPVDRGRPLSDFTHRLLDSELASNVEQVLLSLVPVERELQDESGRWYLTRVLPYRSMEDRIEGVVVTFVDITTRKRAEEELRESMGAALSIVEALHEPLLLLRPDLRVDSANRAFYRYFGVRPEETVGHEIYELGNRQWDIPELRTLLDEVVPEDHVFHDFEVTHEFQTLGRRVMLLNGRRLEGAQLILLGIRDITERKRNEEQLEERVAERAEEVRLHEERFRKLVEASAQMIWTADPEGRVVEDSPTWRAFTGQTFEEWEGEGWLDVVHPEDRELATSDWSSAVRDVVPLENEYRLFHETTGAYRWIHVRAVPLRDDEGFVRGWIGMNIDIDERKRAEEKIAALSSSLAEAEQEERRRISELLHDDVQQLLYGVQMKLATARQGGAMNTDVLLPRVDESLDLLDEVVTKVRRLTIDLSPPVLEGEGLVEALLWLEGQMRELHGLSVEICGGEGIAVGSRGIRILLFQCVRELLFNVAKHADTDCAEVQVARNGGGLKVTVVDHGAGFDPQALQDRTGSGFGLFSIQERLRLQGGTVEIQSRPGEGTRVSLYVPTPPIS